MPLTKKTCPLMLPVLIRLYVDIAQYNFNFVYYKIKVLIFLRNLII